MSRKTKIVTIPVVEGNRDSGKLFLITEMYALPAEKWAMRAFFALTRSGFDVPPELAQSGMAGLAIIGLQALAKVHYEDVEPLMEEMLNCIQIIRDPRNTTIAQPLITDTDIEEISTLALLRLEAFQLHINFSMDAVQSLLQTALMTISKNTKNIQMSQDQSEQ